MRAADALFKDRQTGVAVAVEVAAQFRTFYDAPWSQHELYAVLARKRSRRLPTTGSIESNSTVWWV